MKKNRLFIFVLIFLMLSPLISLAQRDVYNWQISSYGGLLTLNNDIAVPQDANSYAYGLRIERRLGNDFTLGLHFTQLDLDGAANNNISGAFLSLGYHWDNGYLFSQRSTVSIFHRLEAGYLSQYSNLESINSKSSDVAFGFENGLKFRFGDRVSADIAVEILGTQSSITDGDIAKNERYNVWKVGLSYHFGNRKSNYVAPVFVPNGGFPFGSKMNRIDRKDDNIWIANDSIYNTQLKEERFPDPSVDTLVTRPQLSRADSLLIFMHFDSLYRRRDLPDSAFVRADTLAMDSIQPQAIPDSSLVKADSVSTTRIDETLKNRIYSDSIVTDSLAVIENDSTSIRKAAIPTDSVLLIESDTVGIHKADSVSNTRIDETLKNRIYSDTTGTESMAVIESDSTSIRKAAIPTDSVLVIESDTVGIQKAQFLADSSKVNRAIADTLMTNSKPQSVPTDTVYIKDSDQIKQKSDTTLQLKSTVVPTLRVDTVYTEKSERNNQKADSATKAVELKDKSTRVDTTMGSDDKVIPARMDTVYIEKSGGTDQKPDTSAKAIERKAEPSRIDTVYMIQNPVQEKSPRADSDNKERREKDDSNKANETVSDIDSSNQKSSNNNDGYQKNLNKQSDLLAEQNRQIIANQREIERIRKENRKGDTGKMIAAGAAGTALGAIATSGGKNQEPDTVYYESAAAQQKLDSLSLELAELKKEYGITDTIPGSAESDYIPYPPIGMYFSKDSTKADSSLAASGNSTLISTPDSLKMMEDSLAMANKLKADSLRKPDVVVRTATEKPDQPEMKTDDSATEDKTSSQPAADKTASALIGDYPVACNFGLNQTALDGEELKKLDPVITDLKNDNSRKVLLTGYTDSSGNADYNLQLSKKRANSVMDYLTSGGVKADRIEIRGSGVLESADRYSPNARRVDVTIGD